MTNNDLFNAWLVRFELTNAHAAELLGISHNSVAGYRTGKQEAPYRLLLAAAALTAGLKIDLDTLAPDAIGPLDDQVEAVRQESHRRRVAAVTLSHQSPTRKPHPQTKGA